MKSGGFPAASGGAVQDEHLGPDREVAGQGGDLAPDLVLREAVQREAATPVKEPLLAAGPAAVLQIQAGELAAADPGHLAGDAVAVDVGEPQLRAWVLAEAMADAIETAA